MNILSFTINSEPTTTQDAYDAIKTAIGSTHPRWIAWADEPYSYSTGSNTNIVAAVGALSNNSACVFRTDPDSGSTIYGRMRRFNPGTATCTIPYGTKFKAVILPEE